MGNEPPNGPSEQLLANPSFHILVNNRAPIPDGGTFDFDTKLFEINYSEDVDLAALDARLVTALEAELKRKGFERVTDEPDLLLSYAAALDAMISGNDFNDAYAKEFPISLPEPEPHEDLHYHQGAVIVDFVDRKLKTLLWRGAIMAGVSMDVSDEEKDRRCRQGVQMLLAHFPKPIETEK
jgi:hypothetical protein